MLHFNARITLADGVGMGPGVNVVFLTLTTKFSQPGDRNIDSDDGIPGSRSYNAIGSQIEDLLELLDGIFCAYTENTVHIGDLGNGRIALRNPVQRHLDGDHAGTGGTAP